MKNIAHVRKLDNGEWDEPQLLEGHLYGTTELAAGLEGSTSDILKNQFGAWIIRYLGTTANQHPCAADKISISGMGT